MKNREIKFRGWNNEQKEWIHTFRFGLNLEGSILDNNLDEIPLLYWKDKEDRITLSQFTGFKDKSGKDWYEGDIIKHKQGEQEKEMYEYFGVIRFHKGSFYIYTTAARFTELSLRDIDGNEQITRCWHGTYNQKNIYEIAKDFEVVGNIYENEGLLAVAH